MRCVLAKTDGTVRAVNVSTDTLDEIYSILGCSCFDIVTRKFGKHYYDIFCDDEGWLHEGPKVITAFSDDFTEVLVGNIMVARHDDDGNTIALTDEQCEEVLQYVVMSPEGHKTLVFRH